MLGVGILQVDLRPWTILNSQAFTLNANKLAEFNDWTVNVHGERFGRIQGLEERLTRLFFEFQPIAIASEAPFYNPRRPQAYGVLVETIAAIRRAVMQYDVWRELHLIPPSLVKNAVGALGNAKKEVVKEKVIQLPDLNYTGAVPLAYLDEHAIDALGVAYGYFKDTKEKLCL